VWLARSMHQRSLSEFHLDRLTPQWLPTPTQQRLVTLIPGLTAGLFGGLFGGLVNGLVSGLGVGLAGGLFGGLFGGPLVGLVLGLGVGLVFGLVEGLVAGLVVGLVDERFTPNEGIRRSARHALVVGLSGGLFSGLVVGLLIGLRTGGLACLQHLVLRVLLVSNGFAPLRYVRFLDEATGRLFLRRAGSGYLFVHRLLLDYLAQLNPACRLQPTTRRVRKAAGRLGCSMSVECGARPGGDDPPQRLPDSDFTGVTEDDSLTRW
jgi:hypothetical protein